MLSKVLNFLDSASGLVGGPTGILIEKKLKVMAKMSSKKVHKEVGLVDSNPNPNTEIRNTVQSRFSDKLQFIDYF